jgi:hypothetical protein
MKKLLGRTLLLAMVLSCAGAKMDCSSLSGGGGGTGKSYNPYTIGCSWHVFRVRTADTTYFDTSYKLMVIREYNHNGAYMHADTPSLYYSIYGELRFTVNGTTNIPDTAWLHLIISKAGNALVDSFVTDTLPRVNLRWFYFKI